MPLKALLCAAATAIALVAVSASKTEAAVIVYAYESGGNVIFSAGGTLNLDGATFEFSSLESPLVASQIAIVLTGATGAVDIYSGLSGSSFFGSGGAAYAGFGTGDLFGINGNSDWIAVPQGYISGSPLSGSATYVGQTLASLGLTPGH